MQQVLFVRGAKLIRPRQGKPYYRSYPDGYPQNNLCNLPPYYSALAVTLAREFTDFNHTVIYVAQNTSETIWHWQPQGGQSVGVVACHAISTYPRLQEMIMALAQGGTVPFCTWQELDTAILRPDWYPEEFQNFDPENFLPKHSQELTELIASLKAGELATMGLVPLLGETLSTQRLIERLLDYLWGRLNLMLVIKDAFMKQEG